MVNYQNPYMNPYNQQFGYQPQAQPQQQQVVKVNGENGARAYQLAPNSSAILLDESGTMIWLSTSDGAGYKTVTPYDIVPHKVAPPIDYSNLETRISRLEGLINATSTNDSSAIKRKNAKPNDTVITSTD